MTGEMFLDIESLTWHFTMRKKDHNGSPVLISKAHWLNFGDGEEDGVIISHPGEYWMRSSFIDDEACQGMSQGATSYKFGAASEVPIWSPNQPKGSC